MKKLITTFALFITALTLLSATYYVSPTGNDANAGTSQSTAWQTLTKVNAKTFAAGDLMLFQRGGSWNGTLTVRNSGSAGNIITYGAYGEGAKPKIYGSEIITGWTNHSGNIYKATFNTMINQLFINNVRAKSARYPNTGYATINTVNSTTSFTCNALNDAIDYTGSIWIGRTNDWTFQTRNITGSSSKTLTVDTAPTESLNAGEGFVLMNKLDFLDAAGEWYYDDATNTVYLWTPNGDTPSNYEIRGSVYQNGIVIPSGKNYVTIQDLEIIQQSAIGILNQYANYMTVKNNSISDCDSKAIDILSSNNCVIDGNTITGINNYAIFGYLSNSVISNNTISNTALFDNLGLSGMGRGITLSNVSGKAIHIEGNTNLYSYNNIFSTAYSGLAFYGSNNTIEHNYVKDACLVKYDGGGIYTYGGVDTTPDNTGSVIKNNIVDGVISTTAGFTGTIKYGFGIYLDNNSGEMDVDSNTVLNCSYGGIFLHINKDVNVTENVVFNTDYGVFTSDDNGVNTITDNIVYVKNAKYNGAGTQKLVGERYSTYTHIYDNNTYINHYNSNDIFVDTQEFTETTPYMYSFAQWQALDGRDANSACDVSALGVGETEELFYNNTKQTKTFNLGSSVYRDISGTQVSVSLSLEPFTSRILIKTTGTAGDVTKPVVTAFVIPSTSTSLTVPITTFTATDNVGVIGYIVTESSTAPSASDTKWTSTAPTTYTFVSEGAKTLYAWTKDDKGNISNSANDGVTITFSKIGNQTVYASTTSTTNVRRAYPVTMTESGKITSIVFYHGIASAGNEIIVGVYSDSSNKPRNRLGTSARTQLTLTEGWQEIYLTAPATVTAGQKIWIAWQMEAAVNMRYQVGTVTRATRTVTFPSMPSTYGTASYSNFSYSIYAKYSR